METGIASVSISSANQITDGVITQAKLDTSVLLWNLLGG